MSFRSLPLLRQMSCNWGVCFIFEWWVLHQTGEMENHHFSSAWLVR